MIQSFQTEHALFVNKRWSFYSIVLCHKCRCDTVCCSIECGNIETCRLGEVFSMENSKNYKFEARASVWKSYKTECMNLCSSNHGIKKNVVLMVSMEPKRALTCWKLVLCTVYTVYYRLNIRSVVGFPKLDKKYTPLTKIMAIA